MVKYGKELSVEASQLPYSVDGPRSLRVPFPVQSGPGQAYRWAGTDLPSRNPPVQADRLTISPESRFAADLTGMWSILGALFGTAPPGSAGTQPDLSGLLQAIRDARAAQERVANEQAVIRTLKVSVLRQAEALVERSYGLKADGATLRIVFDGDMGNALASVQYRYDSRGRMVDEELHLNPAEFTPDAGPNGVNNHIIQNDRILAHELTHAVMGRNMDVYALPDWFIEGTAEYVAGGAERVNIVLEHLSPQAMLARLHRPWEGDTTQYAAAYVATRYLDQVTAAGGGLRAIMAELHGGASLDEAIRTVSGGTFTDTEAFLAALVDSGAGVSFLRTIDVSGASPGSIAGVRRGADVVPDTGTPSPQPMRGFRVQWPSALADVRVMHPVPWFGPIPVSAAIALYRQQAAPSTREV